MIKRFLTLSIRTHLVVLVCLLIFPSIIMVIYSGLEEREIAIKNSRDDCMRFVTALAARQQSMVMGAEQLTMTLSLLPAIRSRNAEEVSAILSKLPRKDIPYSIITVADKSGLIWASSLPLTGNDFLTDRKYFQDVLRTGLFTSGGYVRGTITKKPILVFGAPVRNRENVLSGVISIGLLLDYAQDVFDKAKLPERSSYSILDHQGIVIYRHLQDNLTKDLQGSSDIRKEEIFMPMLRGPDEGTFTATGNDGAIRLFAYKKLRLSHEQEPYLYIRASITKTAATAPATAKMYHYLSVLALIFVFGIFVSWFIGKRAIMDRIMILKASARKLSEGTEHISVSSVVQGGEIGELADAFDKMAAALSEREKVLRESEERFRKIFDKSPLGIVIVLPSFLFEQVNPSFCNMMEYSADELRSMTFADITHPDYLTQDIENVKKVGQGDIPFYETEKVYITKNGKTLWAKLIVSSIRDEHGELRYYLAMVTDITERKKEEKKLQENTRRLQLATSSAKAGVWDWNLQTNEMIWDERMLELYGLTHESFPGGIEAWKRGLHPDDSAGAIAESEAALHGTRDFDTEFRILRPDGTVVYIKANGIVLRDDEGKPVQMIGLNIDITERKKAEIALLESEERYQSLLEQASDGIFILDARGNIQLVNKSFAIMHGYNVEEMRNLGLERLDVEGSAPVADRIRRIMIGETLYFEVEHYHKDGHIFPLGVTANLVNFGNEQLIIAVHRDLSERKRAEKEKQALEERLSRAEKMEALGLLAGGVAHDLNNVIGIIVGYSELLSKRMDDSDPMRKDLLNIMDAGQRAAAIVDDLLTLARRGVMGRKVLNINKLIFDFNNSPEWGKLHNDHFSVQLKTDLEPDLLNISASPVHLQKTLFNLVANAIEAMPKGGLLTIKTTNQYLDKPVHGYDNIQAGDYVVLSISDTGEGIAERDLQRIFEPFYTKKNMARSGTGLGLAVVWGTVKDHQGYIDVLSKVGKGTVFTLYFPVSREAVAMEAASVSMSEYMGHGESILVVDDVQGQRNLAAAMLKELNYKVVSAACGEDAVEYLRDHKVDLLVLDMIMEPGMDGLDTYKKVLEIAPGQKSIIVSGFSESDRVHEAQALGAGEYIRKPYIQEKLEMAVKKELDRKQAMADSPL